MTDVIVRDVGPRDGLQAEAPLPIAVRVEFIRRLISAGLRHIEVVSFVRDDLVPSMAGAEEVVAALGDQPGVVLYGLVANRRGAERGARTPLQSFTYTLSLSEGYSQRNTRQTITDSLRALAEVVHIVSRPVDVVVSCAFGSPFDDVDVRRDLPKLVTEIRKCGADAVTLADTTGLATPRVVKDIIDLVGDDVGFHLHETRRTALLNAFTALRLGVRRFDTSAGGIGGSPFAPNAAGNLATESLVALLRDEGRATGIDLSALLSAGHWLQEAIGRPLPSPLLQLP